MKNSTLLLCLGLDGIGAYFASLTVEDWLRLLLVTLSLLSLLISFIIKGINDSLFPNVEITFVPIA